MKKIKSWYILDDEKLMARKEVDKSILDEGMHIPKDLRDDFIRYIPEGIPQYKKPIKVWFIINNKEYEVNLCNFNLSRYNGDTVHFRYKFNKELIKILRETFNYSTKKLIDEKDSIKNTSEGDIEYIEFYRTNENHKYNLELKPCKKSLFKLEDYIKDKSNIVQEFFKYIYNGKIGASYQKSYKPILLIAMLQLENKYKKAIVPFDETCEKIIDIYKEERVNKNLKIETEDSAIKEENLNLAHVKGVMRDNPVKVIKDKGYITIENISEIECLRFNPELYNALTQEDKELLLEILWDKYYQYYAEKVDNKSMTDDIDDEDITEEDTIDEIQTPEDNELAAEVEEIMEEPQDYKEVLKHIQTYIKNKGFTYSPKVIKNLYLSLKSKPFAILSGISGTGKSKIVELFAEALGATRENGRFNLIPVKPDWSDSSELIGYRNLQGNFYAGELTNIISRAINEKNKPYFICLDEMNLARVEYYFSDILALMESRKLVDGEYRTDTIIKYESFGEDSSSKMEFGNLYIPENLYIIGTVNMDETTFPFSKKVLDRAFTIEFNEVDLNYAFDFDFDSIESRNISNTFMKSEFNTLKDCVEHRTIAEEIISKLIDINKILMEENNHFAYRVRDEIVFYCIYSEVNNILSRDEAFDLCIKQKILSRIHGNTADTLKVLLDLFNYLNDGDDFKSDGEFIEDSTLNKMKKAIETSNYKESSQKIYSMIRRFVKNGFTTFWE